MGVSAGHLEIKERLKDILPLKNGGSYSLFNQMLYDMRRLKYVRQSRNYSHLKQINPHYNKTCADKKLREYSELGLVENTYQDVWKATDEAVKYLKQEGINTYLLPQIVDGQGFINELNNTDVFVKAINLPDFIGLVYPVFSENNKPYLIPDALLIRGTKERYKLEFLEVEASKSNWDNWLEEKRENYLKLAKNYQAYSVIKPYLTYLNLPIPPVDNFKFSVLIVGKIERDFGKGFKFVDTL